MATLTNFQAESTGSPHPSAQYASFQLCLGRYFQPAHRLAFRASRQRTQGLQRHLPPEYQRRIWPRPHFPSPHDKSHLPCAKMDPMSSPLARQQYRKPPRHYASSIHVQQASVSNWTSAASQAIDWPAPPNHVNDPHVPTKPAAPPPIRQPQDWHH